MRQAECVMDCVMDCAMQCVSVAIRYGNVQQQESHMLPVLPVGKPQQQLGVGAVAAQNNNLTTLSVYCHTKITSAE